MGLSVLRITVTTDRYGDLLPGGEAQAFGEHSARE